MPSPFLSTLSLRRATGRRIAVLQHGVFLSTLSLRRATNTGQPVRGLPSYFYPRSPCGERPIFAPLKWQKTAISIHALLAESDRFALRVCVAFAQFLSTLSLRRATYTNCVGFLHFGDFYPRSPCGERLWTGRDLVQRFLFLSTLSLRRATHLGQRKL